MREFEGVSVQQTAQILGIRDGTVKVRTTRARADVKRIVRKSLEGNGDVR